MIYIVAGNAQQAKNYARKHGIWPPSWKYVNNEKDLLDASGSVIFTGTFYERADKIEIAVAVENAGLKRLDDE